MILDKEDEIRRENMIWAKIREKICSNEVKIKETFR